MIRSDFHVHSTFCDGKAEPEAIVLKAISLGMAAVGFSSHSWLPGEEDWTLSKDYGPYRTEILRLKEKYAGQIDIYCGIEQDILSPLPDESFDYMIGSVHSLKTANGRFVVDMTPEDQDEGVERCFGGDIYAAAEAYFEKVGSVIDVTHADIIGHFDLFSKYNEGNVRYDPCSRRYFDAGVAAIDRLLKHGVPFEVNTGAISRGWRTEAYPDLMFVRYIAEHGGSFVLSSDSHSIDSLCLQFDKYEALFNANGWKLCRFGPKVL